MRSDLDHLPIAEQRELERVVEFLFEELEEARACATSRRKKAGRILKIILFGSYARGEWVEEPRNSKGYRSDYDLLIGVSHPDLKDVATYWYAAEDRILHDPRAAVSLVRDASDVLARLLEGGHSTVAGACRR